MTTPIEKRNNNKFCEFHGEVGHTTDECMHLRRQIEELIKAGKLSHVIKELKQGSGKDQPKTTSSSLVTVGTLFFESKPPLHRPPLRMLGPRKDLYTTAFLKILTMSEPAELIPIPPTSVVRNTVGKGNEQISINPNRPASDAALQECCDKYYHQLLPIIAEKVHQEKVQQEKLKEVKARLNFEVCSGRNSKIQEVSQHSESRTPDVIGDLRTRLRNVSAHSESRYQSSRSRRTEPTPRKRYHEGTSSRRTEPLSESEDSGGGHWKSRSKKQKSSIEEDDLSQPWVCEETDPFTPRIRYFDFPKKTRMPSNVKTYDGSDDLEDHLKIFQAAAKVERWAMPTWCHMFNSTLTGSARVWFDDLPLESVDSYDDLKKAFLANFLQQKKCIKDPVEIHHIKQREGESTEDFVRKKTLPAWKQQEAGRKQNFDRRGDFRNQQRSERRRDKFTLLTKSPKKILALDKVGNNIDECMHLKRQIKELIKAGKMSHVIKELKQGNGKDQPKAAKKGETSGKDKPLAILMVQQCRASPERPRRMPSSQTKEKKPSVKKEQGNTRGSSKTDRRRNNEGSPLPQLVVKSCNGKKA
ncbi:reverse transcriptase domain-containing protein [Tanacetum coccineum]